MIQQLFLSTGIDADAQAFITAAGITDAVQKSAVNRLAVDLKAFGLWSKMHALYPFVGGTASAHSLNLKSPLFADSSYRLIFNGGWTHSAGGATPDGSTGYADTRYGQATYGTLNNEHIAVYVRTQTADISPAAIKCEIGVATAESTAIFAQRTSADLTLNIMFARSQAVTIQSIPNTDSRGFYSISRTGGTEFRQQRNTTIQTNGIASENLCAHNFYIGARNLSGTADAFTNRQLGFASIGSGLTSTEMQNFYTAVQMFQTILGRQV